MAIPPESRSSTEASPPASPSPLHGPLPVHGERESPADEEGYQWTPRPGLWPQIRETARQNRKQATEAEKMLWERVRGAQLGFQIRRQYVVDRFIVDFYCPPSKPVIEVDGPIHAGLHEQDSERQHVLEALGFQVMRFSNERVINDLDHVVDDIRTKLPLSPLPASGERRGEGTHGHT
jgi:very-short-patch-repair endonuclease